MIKFNFVSLRAVLFLFVFIYALSIVVGCKKDHSNHNEIPYQPYAVYVAEEDEGKITVINPLENKVVGSIVISDHHSSQMGLMPHNVQVAPDGKSVWVTATAHDGGDMEQVIVIDPVANHSILKKINVGVNQHLGHIVLDTASTYAFATANEAGQVIQIDAKTYTEVKRYNLGATYEPHGLRYSKGNLYVANMGAKSMSIINISSGQIDEVPLGGMAVQTAVTPDGKYAFASLYDTKEVAMYDIQTKQVIKIALPAGALGPIQLYPTPDNKLLYVCDQGGVGTDPVSNKVYVIDIAASSVTNTIDVGNAAHGVVVSNDGQSVYVTNSKSNTVSVIDVATQKVTHTISVGEAPNGISYKFPTGGMQ